MRIMVFDVPAESGGALTVLNQYYNAAIKDRDIEWIFVVSTPKLKESENVKVLNYPWIKKSWFHRLYFDKFIAHKLVEKHNADEVISLQNVVVPKVKVMQTLYLHQALIFAEKRYSIIENYKFWCYQNLISILIFNSVNKADKVIVQTNWFKELCVKKLKVDPNKIIVKKPVINIKVTKKYRKRNNELIFFYPAAEMSYKNHKVIVDAIRSLKEYNTEKFKVLFTLNGHETKEIRELYKIVITNELPIDFIGTISQDAVYDLYSKSIMIFPSYIETFGLPLLEASLHNSPILASDSVYAREVLEGYEHVNFFNPFDSTELAALIKNYFK